MKKLFLSLIVLCFISINAFAVDYVGVNSGSARGKFSKTTNPTFATVTTTTFNYVVTGNVTCNSLVVTSSTASILPVATITTANISHGSATFETGTINALVGTTATITTVSATNLGKALNAGGFGITNAGAWSGTTGAFSSLVSIGNSPNITTWSGVASFNYAITVTANGKLVTIPVKL